MEKIKQHLFRHFETLFTLFIVSGISLFLLMIRLKITHSYFFLFLVWNLFLAAIPFVISFFLSHKKKLPKIGFFIGCVVWLLFLPNAPYIITDLIHLRHSGATQFWFDVVMIGLFAGGGVLFYLFSLEQMEAELRRFISEGKVRISIAIVPFLTGFGIYLGRFLRWNSWDILQQPHILLNDIFDIVLNPMDHLVAWLTIGSFGIGLSVIYHVFRKIQKRL